MSLLKPLYGHGATGSSSLFSEFCEFLFQLGVLLQEFGEDFVFALQFGLEPFDPLVFGVLDVYWFSLKWKIAPFELVGSGSVWCRCSSHYTGTELRVPGGPGRLPARGSHRPVRARISAYGSSIHGFAA